MLGRPLRIAVIAASTAAAAACVSYNSVPLRDGAFPRGAIQVGDEVRAATRSGDSLAFEVASVEGNNLTGDEGERLEGDELASLEVKRFNKRATIITASVVGGIIGTALIINEIEDTLDCSIDLFEDDCD